MPSPLPSACCRAKLSPARDDDGDEEDAVTTTPKELIMGLKELDVNCSAAEAAEGSPSSSGDSENVVLSDDNSWNDKKSGRGRNGQKKMTRAAINPLESVMPLQGGKFPGSAVSVRGVGRAQPGAMAQWPFVGVQAAAGSPLTLGRPGQQVYPMGSVMAQLNGASPTSSLCAVGPSIDSLVQPGAAGVAGMAALQSPLQYASAGASQVPPNMVLIPPSANGQHDYSLTNLYIRGLGPNTKDADLYNMCCEFGNIISTKAIVDKTTNLCKGYGFVDFETHQAAATAQTALKDQAVDVHFARLSMEKPHGHGHNSSNGGQNSTSSERSANLDTTNLYIANLPYNVDEKTLESILEPCGTIVSTRILRDLSTGQSKGVGFCRMQTKESCERAIAKFNGQVLPSFPGTTPLHVKFADISNRRRVSTKSEASPPLFPESFDTSSPLTYDVSQAGQVFQFQQFLPPYHVLGRQAVPVSTGAVYGQPYMQQAVQASPAGWPAGLVAPAGYASGSQQAAYIV